MKPALTATALAMIAVLAACAPAVVGGPAFDLPPALRDSARLNAIIMSSDLLNAETDFADTLAEEVREELQLCMGGTVPVDLRIHVDDLERAGRLDVLLNGEGAHSLSATAEFVDVRDGSVIGRYPIRVATQAGGRVAGLLGDRQMMVSEEFGRALCATAFGRNPRTPGPRNATRG